MVIVGFLFSLTSGPTPTGYRCKAFDEIPSEILSFRIHHTKPYPGDRGIQLEPVPRTERRNPR